MTAPETPPPGRKPEAAAHEAALRLLGYRARSSVELRQRLLKRGFAPGVVAAELERLKNAGLLDDRAFAASWVQERTRLSPRGSAALRRELRQRGIDRETIEDAVATVDDGDAALRLARGRAPALQSAGYEAFMRRMAGYLQRRGIEGTVAGRAAHRAWQELPAGPEPGPAEDPGFL